MSRIFDALRQSVRGTAEESTAKLADNTTPAPDLNPLHKTGPEVIASSQSIFCRVTAEGRIVGGGQNHNLGAEKFRFLRQRLNLLRQHRALSRILITSAIPKEGKTLVAINLAVSFARGSSRVALIDADLRQPGVNRALGLGSLPGLAEFLEGKLELAAGIRRVDPLGFYYLPAGMASTNPFELLQGPRMRELMNVMTPAFDWIVFDSPPLIPFADANYLASLTNAVLLVVRASVSPRAIVQQALEALNGAYVAGVVLNASDDMRRDQYYYEYYPSGSGPDPGPSNSTKK